VPEREEPVRDVTADEPRAACDEETQAARV
jgi:hypothetical protein